MTDYTPSIALARECFVDGAAGEFIGEDFDQMLEFVRAEAEQRGAKKERERVARNIEEWARRVAPAPPATRGGDYWTGLIRAARIAREGA